MRRARWAGRFTTIAPGWLLLAACACPAADAGSDAGSDASAANEARFELVVLGIAQDGGLPHFGCDRPCCEAARRDGRELYPASLGVVDRQTGALLLVEATPRIEAQVALLHAVAGAEQRGRRPVDAVLLTHAHIGHYLGLAQFGREVAATTAVATFCSPRMAGFLRGHGPWRQLVELHQLALHELPARSEVEVLPGLSVQAIPVPHRDEFSDTMAYKLTGPQRTALFVPDIDAWRGSEELLDELLSDVDVAFIDATFYDGRELVDRDLSEIRHPLMVDTMQRLAGFAASRPGVIRFLHLNHTNPVLHDAALQRAIEARGFAIAARGETFGL